MSTCYLVLGTPRSGNNAISGVLHRLGVFMGERWIGEADDWNPKGYYQDGDFADLHSSMLGGWDVPLPDARKYITQELKDQHDTLIERRISQYNNWGVSGVELPWLVEDFQAHCEVKLIITSRPFEESVASYSERTLYTLAESRETLQRSVDKIAAVVENWEGEIITISFHALMDDTVNEISKLATYSNLPLTTEAANFIDQSLRRFG